jgi:hypothetical protein
MILTIQVERLNRSAAHNRSKMKIIPLLFTWLLIVTASGCGPRNVYDGLRYNRELECQKLHGPDQSECLRRSGMSYAEYQRHLKEQPTDR